MNTLLFSRLKNLPYLEISQSPIIRGAHNAIEFFYISKIDKNLGSNYNTIIGLKEGGTPDDLYNHR